MLIQEGVPHKRSVSTYNVLTALSYAAHMSLVCAGDVVNAISPQIHGLPQGQSGVRHPHLLDVSNSKAVRLFPGFEFKTLEVSATDLALQLHAKGWLLEPTL